MSLRGIGPSGQSRTLVLLDGIPFNDPFGGWVYWTRVPLESVDRIEMTDGTNSSLYGNYAMGGVINIITTRPTRQMVDLKTQYGDHGSPKFDLFASDRWNNVGAALEGSFFKTDGFPIVAPIERGPIDNNADVAYSNVSAKIDYAPTDSVNAFFRAGYFSENRNNAKIGELNDTRWTTINGGLRARLRDGSDLQARVFGDISRAHFNFLAVTNAATTRNIVRLATDQNVPTNGVGGVARGPRRSAAATSSAPAPTGAGWTATARKRPTSPPCRPSSCVPAVPTGRVRDAALLSVQRISGGTQQISGAFVQDIFTPTSQLVLTLSARVDHWRNYDGHNLETTVSTGQPTGNNRPVDSRPQRLRREPAPCGAVPRVRSRERLGRRELRLPRTDAHRAVPSVLGRRGDDASQQQLGPERLVGGEAGVNVAAARNVTVRLTWFDNRLTDPVANVTQANAFCSGRAVPAGCAQKQNLGETRIRGVQTDAEYRIGQSWRVSGAYVFDDATVTDGGPNNPALVGKWIPQVPRHRGTLQASYTNAKIATIAFAMQAATLHTTMISTRTSSRRRRSSTRATTRSPRAVWPRAPRPASARAFRVTRPSISPRRATSAATCRCSSACRTCSIKCRRRADERPLDDRNSASGQHRCAREVRRPVTAARSIRSWRP